MMNNSLFLYGLWARNYSLKSEKGSDWSHPARMHVIACAKRGPKPTAPPPKTSGLVPASIDDAYLLSQFHEAYPALAAKITTPDQVRNLVNISPEVRDWYLDLKADSAVVSSLPESMQKGGVTPEIWRGVQDKVEAARKLERDLAAETNAAALTFKRSLETISQKRVNFYKGTSPYVVIARMSQEQLPLDDLVEIALQPDVDKRKAIVKSKLDAAMEKACKDVADGTWSNPFS